MFIVIEPDVATFGTISPDWDHVDSDVLLTTSDEEPLDQGIAVGFAAYCQHHVRPFVEWALKVKRADRLPRIRRARKEITPNKWAAYKVQYRKMLDESEEVTEDTVGGAPRMGLVRADASKVVARFVPTDLPDITSLAFI